MITERQLSMQHDLQSHQQDSLPRILLCLHEYSSKRLAMQNLQILDTAETRIIPKWLFSPTSQIKTDIPP
jgi:hypothetical protein